MGVTVGTDASVARGIDGGATEPADGTPCGDDLFEAQVEGGALVWPEAHLEGWFGLLLVAQLEGVEDHGAVALIEADGHTANAKLVRRLVGEVGGWLVGLGAVVQLGEGLHEGQIEGLEVLFFDPKMGEATGRADDAQAEGALAGLAKRLGVDGGGGAELDGHAPYGMIIRGVRGDGTCGGCRWPLRRFCLVRNARTAPG